MAKLVVAEWEGGGWMQPDNHSASLAAGKWFTKSVHPHLSGLLLISSAASQRECPSDMLKVQTGICPKRAIPYSLHSHARLPTAASSVRGQHVYIQLAMSIYCILQSKAKPLAAYWRETFRCCYEQDSRLSCGLLSNSLVARDERGSPAAGVVCH